jgi:predicted phage tail protein
MPKKRHDLRRVPWETQHRRQDFQELAGDSDIRIAPVMEGAKKAGMFQTILGAVMVLQVSPRAYSLAGPVSGQRLPQD